MLQHFKNEKERLKQVFRRLISFILFFACQNIAFTGSSSSIHDTTGKNGNFLQLINTVAEFDNVLKEHIKKNPHVHYMSPYTQNELIKIIGTKVQKSILDSVKQSKYFSIIADGTSDITHAEQMTLVLRYVLFNEADRRYEIKESFVKFVNATVKTGQGISQTLLGELSSSELDLNPNDIRGQGYDNGPNMKGKNIGVQKIILEKYPLAFFVPCLNHSLNLAVNDAAATGEMDNFFSFVNHIFVFLSGSTNRWDVLKAHLASSSAITPKPICTTRWSSRVDAMKPLRHNPDKIIATLKEIANSSTFKTIVRVEAESIVNKINFEFICCVCLWYDILNQINIASKALQSIS